VPAVLARARACSASPLRGYCLPPSKERLNLHSSTDPLVGSWEVAAVWTFFLIHSLLWLAAKLPPRWGVADQRVALARRPLPANSVDQKGMISNHCCEEPDQHEEGVHKGR
jgi:hypothetical protein